MALLDDEPDWTQEQLIEEGIAAAEAADAELRAYRGDEFMVSSWVENGGKTREEAIAIVQEPMSIALSLDFGAGLEGILADKYASAGLQKCLLDRNEQVRCALEHYAKRRKRRGKPGPRPKDGKYRRDKLVALRKEGLTFGEIALRIYGTSAKRNVVSAHLAQAKRKPH